MADTPNTAPALPNVTDAMVEAAMPFFSAYDSRDVARRALEAALAAAQQPAVVDHACAATGVVDHAQQPAEPGELLVALEDFLQAQDALDNRELQGPNAECHFKLMGRRNNAREFLDAAIAKAASRSAGVDVARNPQQENPEPADPLDLPLPCDVKVGHGTHRKGTTLRTLVARMKVLYEMAMGEKADDVAALSPEQRAERFALFQRDLAAGCKPTARDSAPVGTTGAAEPQPAQADREPCGCTAFEREHCRGGFAGYAQHPGCTKRAGTTGADQ